MSAKKTAIKLDVLLAFVFGVIFLSVLLAVAIYAPDPAPALLVTVTKIIIALAAAGVAATIPGFLEVKFSPSTAVVVRAGGAIAVFVLIFFFVPAGLVVSEDGQKCYEKSTAPYNIVTHAIGLQFKQRNCILPVVDGVVKIRREPFEVLLKERTWASITDEYPALQVMVSENPKLVDLNLDDVFQRGTGMADNERGFGGLYETDLEGGPPYSHNYIIGSRFNVEEGNNRGFFVSAVPGGKRQNLLLTALRLYMVFHLDPTETTTSDHRSARKVDPRNIDVVTLELTQ
jgi:hypothetical protein